ncbi:thioesterase II family protein [Pseudomonas putida]
MKRCKTIDAPERRFNIICLPYGGAGAALFDEWQSKLKTVGQVHGLDLPGRGRRYKETPIKDMHELAEFLYSTIRGLIAEPYVIFGHSLGALCGYHLLKCLQVRRERLPYHFIVSACRPPHLPYAHEGIWRDSEEVFLKKVAAFGGTPKEVIAQPQLFKVFSSVLKADFRLADWLSEKPVAPIRGVGCTVFYGSHDPIVPVEQLSEWAGYFENVDFEMFDGDHFFITSKANEVLLAMQQILTHGRGAQGL